MCLNHRNVLSASIVMITFILGLVSPFNIGEAYEDNYWWREYNNGLSGLTIVGIEVDSNNPSIVYALTPNDGLYKSTDGGDTWIQKVTGISGSLTLISGHLFGNLLTMDPSDNTNLYACFGGQVHKSTDSGETWTNIGVTDCDCPYVFSGSTIDPQDSNHLIAATVTSGPCQGTLWETKDGGLNWEHLAWMVGGGAELNNDGWTVTFDPTDASRLYISTVYRSFLYSVDGGKNWTFNGPLPLGAHNDGYTAVVHPGMPNRILVGHGKGIHLSENYGHTNWIDLNVSQYEGVYDINFAQLNNNIVYAASRKGLLKSADGGLTWSHIPLPEDLTLRSLAIHPQYPSIDTLFLGSTNGMYKLTNAETDIILTRINNGLPSSFNVSTTAIAPSDPNVYYCTIYNRGFYRSSDKGKTWELKSTNDYVIGTISILVDNENCNVVYAGYKRILRSTNGGDTWEIIFPADEDKAFQYFKMDHQRNPVNDLPILYATSVVPSEFFKSTNGGQDWIKKENFQYGSLQILPIALDPAQMADPDNHRIIYVGSHAGFQKSEDGGNTWTRIIPGSYPYDNYVDGIAVDQVDPNRIYITTAGTNIYTSTNRGDDWSQIQSTVSGWPGRIFIDQEDHGVFYVFALYKWHKYSNFGDEREDMPLDGFNPFVAAKGFRNTALPDPLKNGRFICGDLYQGFMIFDNYIPDFSMSTLAVSFDSPAGVGSILTYTAWVINTGAQEGLSILLKIPIPEGAQYVEGSIIVDGVPAQVDQQNSELHVELGDMYINQDVEVTYQLEIIECLDIEHAVTIMSDVDVHVKEFTTAETLVLPYCPVIESWTPYYGLVYESTIITIQGVDFDPNCTVTLGTDDNLFMHPLDQTYNEPTRIEAIVPAVLPIGSYHVTVQNPDLQIDTLENGFYIIHFNKSPSLWIGNYPYYCGESSISIYDTLQKAMVDEIVLEGEYSILMRKLVSNTDGTIVFGLDDRSKELYVFSTGLKQIIHTLQLPLTTKSFSFSDEQRNFYILSSEKDDYGDLQAYIQCINFHGKQCIDKQPVLLPSCTECTDLEVSPDGRFIYIVGMHDKKVSIVDVSSWIDDTATITEFYYDRLVTDLRVSFNNQRIYILTSYDSTTPSTQTIEILDRQGDVHLEGDPVLLCPQPDVECRWSSPHSIEVSPDNSMMTVTMSNGTHVYFIDLNNNEIVQKYRDDDFSLAPRSFILNTFLSADNTGFFVIRNSTMDTGECSNCESPGFGSICNEDNFLFYEGEVRYYSDYSGDIPLYEHQDCGGCYPFSSVMLPTTALRIFSIAPTISSTCGAKIIITGQGFQPDIIDQSGQLSAYRTRIFIEYQGNEYEAQVEEYIDSETLRVLTPALSELPAGELYSVKAVNSYVGSQDETDVLEDMLEYVEHVMDISCVEPYVVPGDGQLYWLDVYGNGFADDLRVEVDASEAPFTYHSETYIQIGVSFIGTDEHSIRLVLDRCYASYQWGGHIYSTSDWHIEPYQGYFNLFPLLTIRNSAILPGQMYTVFFGTPEDSEKVLVGEFEGSDGFIEIDPGGVWAPGTPVNIPTAQELFGVNVMLPQWASIRLNRNIGAGFYEHVGTQPFGFRYVPVGISNNGSNASTSSLSQYSEIDHSDIGTSGTTEMQNIVALSDYYPLSKDHFYFAQGAIDNEPPRLYISKGGGDLRNPTIVDYKHFDDATKDLADPSHLFPVGIFLFGLHPKDGIPVESDHTFSYVYYDYSANDPFYITEQRINFKDIYGYNEGVFCNPHKGLWSIFSDSPIACSQLYFGDKYRDYLWVEMITGVPGPWIWLIDFDADKSFTISQIKNASTNTDEGDIHSIDMDEEGDILKARIKLSGSSSLLDLYLDYYNSSNQTYYPMDLSSGASSGNLGSKYFRTARAVILDPESIDSKSFLAFYSYNEDYTGYTSCAKVALDLNNSTFSITHEKPILNYETTFVLSPYLEHISIAHLAGKNYLLAFAYIDDISGDYMTFVKARVINISDGIQILQNIDDINVPLTQSPCESQKIFHINEETMDAAISPRDTEEPNYFAEDIATTAEGDMIVAYRYFIKCSLGLPDIKHHRIEMRRYKEEGGAYNTYEEGPTVLGTYQHIYSDLFYINIDRSVSVAMKDYGRYIICWDDSEKIDIGIGILNDIYVKVYHEGDEKDFKLPRSEGVGYSSPSLACVNNYYSLTYIETHYLADPIFCRVMTRKYDLKGSPLSDAITVLEYTPEQLNLGHFTPVFFINTNEYGSSAFSIIKKEPSDVEYYRIFISRLNQPLGTGSVVSYSTDPTSNLDRYVAVTLPGANKIKVIDQHYLDLSLDSYIKEVDIQSDPYYQNLIKNIDLPSGVEGPTGLAISEVESHGLTPETKTMAFVAATYTTQKNYLLLYEINGSTWTPYPQQPTIDLTFSGEPQFADIEIRADKRYLYLGLPKANRIIYLPLDKISFKTGEIPATNPIDIALVPYINTVKAQAKFLIEILNQTPEDAFDKPESLGLLLRKAKQLEAKIEQPATISKAQDALFLRALVREKVVDEFYQGLIIKEIDNILMMLMDSYVDPEYLATYAILIKTVINGLPSSAFDNPDNRDQIVNKTKELEEKIINAEYCHTSDIINDIEQLINYHVNDHDILLILDQFITCIKDVNHAPSALSLISPIHMEEITTANPILTINNSQDPDCDSLTYKFEIYSNADFTPPPVASAHSVPEGDNGISSWQCDVPLQKNVWYYWRVRATDGTAYSNWATGSFFVSKTDISIEMNLQASWGMISLPVMPVGTKLAELFPEAVVVYKYEKGVGYKRVIKEDEMEIGIGYWILLDQGKSYTLTGELILSYIRAITEEGWYMIGGCTYPAKASTDNCSIDIIYGYVPEVGYKQIPDTEYLEPGKGYWMLLKNVAIQATVNIETVLQIF